MASTSLQSGSAAFGLFPYNCIDTELTLLNIFCFFSGRHHINWSESVLLSDVKSTYYRFVEDRNNDTTAGPATNHHEESTAQILSINATEESAGHGQPNVEKTVDDFRIRKSTSVSDISAVDEAAKSGVPSATEETTSSSDDFPSTIRSVFDHLSAIFPCVFELSSGSVVNDTQKNPYVTLSPSFLEQLNNEELFLALDAAMRTFSNDGFLSKEPNLELPIPWLERLSSQAHNDATTSTSVDRVPMYSIVLARIELAVFETYRGQLQSEPSIATATSLDHSPSPDEKKNVGVDGDADLGHVDESISSPMGPVFVAAADNSAGITAKSRRSTFDLQQIKNVLAFSQVLHGNGSMSASTMTELSRPFVQVWFGSKSNYHVDINRLVVIPLPWILHSREDDQQNGRAIDFVHLDEALREVLKALADRASDNDTTKRALKDGAVHGASCGRIRTANVGVVHGTPRASNGVREDGNAPETTSSSITLEDTVDTPPSNNNSKKKKKKKKKPKAKVCYSVTTLRFFNSVCSRFLTLMFILDRKIKQMPTQHLPQKKRLNILTMTTTTTTRRRMMALPMIVAKRRQFSPRRLRKVRTP
jgi:hypothetical protein